MDWECNRPPKINEIWMLERIKNPKKNWWFLNSKSRKIIKQMLPKTFFFSLHFLIDSIESPQGGDTAGHPTPWAPRPSLSGHGSTGIRGRRPVARQDLGHFSPSNGPMMQDKLVAKCSPPRKSLQALFARLNVQNLRKSSPDLPKSSPGASKIKPGALQDAIF